MGQNKYLLFSNSMLPLLRYCRIFWCRYIIRCLLSIDWGLSSFSIASNQTNKAKVNILILATLLHSIVYVLQPLQRYPPPQVPRDFVPVHNFGNTAAASSVGTAGNHHHKPLTSAVRTQMLSDAPGKTIVCMIPCTPCTCMCDCVCVCV